MVQKSTAAAVRVAGWELEREAWLAGAQWVAGVDEVGRGPLFGPVVAAAVVLPRDCAAEDGGLVGLRDSKQLREAERERLAAEVCARALAWAVAEVDAATIDRINIREATRLAMRRAVEALAEESRPGADFVLVDGNCTVPELRCGQRTVIGGDARCASIAAASVVAKVHRDAMMRGLDAEFPGYGLARHKGYGTRVHLEALERLGATREHRRSFAPVRRVLASRER